MTTSVFMEWCPFDYSGGAPVMLLPTAWWQSLFGRQRVQIYGGDTRHVRAASLIELKHWPRDVVERMFAESALKETPR